MNIIQHSVTRAHAVKLALATAFALSFAFASSAYAANIGYVDAEKLVNLAPQGVAESKKLEAEFAERNRELRTRFKSLRKDEAKLEKDGLLMTAGELAEKAESLRVTKRQLQRAEREYNEDFGRRRDQRLKTLRMVITEAVIAIAERESLDAVFQNRYVVYAGKNIDITDKVLDELKALHKKKK